MENKLNELKVEFQFNPPHASNMGGAWERLIRSTKQILQGMGSKYIGRLCTSQLRTLFYETMAIMNCRPLGYVSEQQVPLCPNMLLTMKTDVVLPPPGTFEESDIYSRKRWRVVQQLANEFWQRWRKEYLHTLQVRQKWVEKVPGVSVGDVVLVKEDCPRNSWPLARVVECIESHDGEVRSVRLLIGKRHHLSDKCQYLDRPVTKIVVLVKAATG